MATEMNLSILGPLWRTLELPGLSLKLYTKVRNIGLAYDVSQRRR